MQRHDQELAARLIDGLEQVPNLRIMGIFTRLAQRDGKRRYLAFMPRVWDAIQRDLSHPALAPLAAALEGVPAPSARVIEGIAAA